MLMYFYTVSSDRMPPGRLEERLRFIIS